MIDHNLFKLPEKPNKLKFISIKITDEIELLNIKKQKRSVVEQALFALNSKQFIEGIFFASEILDKFKSGLFSRIEVKIKNDLIVCIYNVNNIQKEEIFDNTIKLEKIINILKDSGYNIEVRLKQKIYTKKINEYNYKIRCLGEKLLENFLNEFKIKNKEIATKLFNVLWKKNKYDSVKTQIEFMKNLSQYRKQNINI